MAVTYTANSGYFTSGVKFSPHDVTTLTIPDSSNRALVAILAANGTPDSVTVTWDYGGAAQALSLIDNYAVSPEYLQLWGLAGPVTGNKTLRIAWGSNPAAWRGIIFSVEGAAQTSTFVNVAEDTGVDETASSLTINSNTGHLVVAQVGAGVAISTLSGTTLYKSGNTGGNMDTGASPSVNMTATFNRTTWYAQGFSINAASIGMLFGHAGLI